MITLFLHVGLHKTGTTFLQKNVFNSFPNVIYLGKPMSSNMLIDSLIKNDNEKYIYSDEALIGGLLHRYKTNEGTWLNDQITSIKRLGKLFPNAKILIGFRKHASILKSMYKHYLNYGGNKKLEQYFSFDGTGIIKPDDLLFAKRLEYIDKYFKYKPFVYTLEEIQYSLNNFINRLSNYIGDKCLVSISPLSKKQNVGVNHYQAKMLLLFNRLAKDPRNRRTFKSRFLRYFKLSPYHLSKYLLFFDKQALKLPPTLEHEINNYYKEDWNYIQKYMELTQFKVHFK